MAEKEKADAGSLTDTIGLGGLKDAAGSFASSLVNRGIGKVSNSVEGLSGKLSDFSEGKSSPGVKDKAMREGLKAKITGKSPAVAAVRGAGQDGGGGKGSRKQKVVNIVEWIDVGVPVTVAYNQWTEFEEWSDFMKKVENVEQKEDERKVEFKGKVFLSHRSWEATIKEMVPDDRIIWKSKGQKGHLDGAVTFHEVAPRLTRICAVVEYYPQGLFEKTGQIWRAVGRRVRVELKRYVRHVMTTTILDPESAVGWRGEIRDGEIVRTHDEVVEEEQQEREREDQGEREDEYEPEGEAQGEEAEDEGEYESEAEEGEAEDEGEYESEAEEGEDEYEDEEEEDEEEEGEGTEGGRARDEEDYEDEEDAEDEEDEEAEDEYDDYSDTRGQRRESTRSR